ncbi:MAG TPA: hypothetical protein VKR99_07145 [Candidatus Eremiobacteraceae bacterium]|nr:hypothetical protein [Candidatus Eremiobacteraceae bacterium]
MVELPLHYGQCDGFVRKGRVTAVSASSITVRMTNLSPASLVSLDRNDGTIAHAQVRWADQNSAQCTPVDGSRGVLVGAPAIAAQTELGAYVGPALLGAAVDAWGRGDHAQRGGLVARHRELSLNERRPITNSIATGIAAIDGFCSVGAGQRIALFAGAGVGKSTLLREVMRHASCDAHVLAMVGERAREASETIAALQNGERWTSTTVVCATAGAPPMERLAAVRTAQAQAEWLCSQGCHVLLTVDSLTRVAAAWREIALAAGEVPAHRGHPASMVSMLASVVENAGARDCGSITGIYSVLIDGDDPYEPVTDALRGLLDGHIMLSRRLADAGRFPAIDVLRSSSRLMHVLSSPQHAQDANLLRRALATLEDNGDLLALGAYRRGGDPWLDAVLDVREDLETLLYHGSAMQPAAAEEMARIARKLRSAHGRGATGA